MKRDLTTLPIFDHTYARCGGCELQPRCEAGKMVTAHRPKAFNGIMLVGEGPGQSEVLYHRPFVGASGKLLTVLLRSVGIELDECFVTNATLCEPGKLKAQNKALHSELPNAIPSCSSRLEAEIAAVRPTVIIALGAAAWAAISGADKQYEKRVAFDCADCDEHRKVGPVLQCAASIPNPDDGGATAIPCGHFLYLNAAHPDMVNAAELIAHREQPCPKCGAGRKRLRAKMIKCPSCGGRKSRPEPYSVWEWDFNVSDVAGGIFEPRAADAPADIPKQAHELSSWYGTQGVKYIIPTLHPAYILRGQQFITKAVQKHFAKARRLLGGARPLTTRHEVTKDPAVVRAFHKKVAAAAANITVDIETEAIGPDGEALDAREIRNVTKITVIGFSIAGEHALVVDTRHCDLTDPTEPLLNELYELLVDTEVSKTYHHGAGYDLPVLDKVWGFPWDEMVPSYTDDTMFAHGNLYPDMPHKLGGVTFECADVRAWKPPRTVKGVEAHQDFEEHAAYNGRDVCHTALVRDSLGVLNGKAVQGGRMHRAGLARVYEGDTRLRQIAVGMTMAGVPIDRDVLEAAGREAGQHVEAARASLAEALESAGFPNPETFNPDSTPQLNKLLYGNEGFLHLPIVKQTESGAGATDKETLLKLLGTSRDAIVLKILHALIDLRKHVYVERNFVNSADFIPWPDGRIHTVWKPWGTKTGRFSSSPNLQNIPGWLRAAFVAPQGRKIVGADEDQLEIRNLAWLCGDENLIYKCLNADDKRKLEPEHDPHSYVASLAFEGRYTNLLLKDPNHDATAEKRAAKCKCETCRRKSMRDMTKCLHPDTLVWGVAGPQPISAAKVGALIRTPGAWTRIVAKEATQSACVHVVTMRGIVTCSKNHRWPLEDGRLVEAGALVAGDVISQPTERLDLEDAPYPLVQLPGGAIRGVPVMTVPLSHDWAYLAGLWCGDGSISGHGGRISHGAVSKVDLLGCSYATWQQVIAKAVAAVGFVPKLETLGVGIGDRHAMRIFGVLGLSTTPPVVGNAREHVRAKRNLRLPPWVLSAGRTAILHYLGGLIDTDGCVHRRADSITLVTKDAVFAGQIAAVAQALDLRVAVDPSWNKTYSRYYWVLRFPGSSIAALAPYMRHPGKLARMRPTPCSPNHHHMFNHRVKLVLDAGTLETWDIQVDAADHLFVSNTMASHNSVIYGLNYGAGNQTTLETIYNKGYEGPPITLDIIEHLRRTVFRAFAKIQPWQNAQIALARETGELRSPLWGRRRIFPLAHADLGMGVPETEVKNFPIQSLGADLMNEALILFADGLPDYDPQALIIAQIHDAIYAEVDEDKAESVSKFLSECMTSTRTSPEGVVMKFTAGGHVSQTLKA